MSNWVAWRYVTKDGKQTKVPFNAYEPSRHAKPNDPSTWATSKAALEALHSGEADGIGFMLHGTQYAAIDLDNCLDGDTPAPWAAQLVNEAHQQGAYVEITPSGKGLRIIGTADGNPAHNKFETENGGSVECYRKATRYITVSREEVGECGTLPNIDGLIDRIVAQYGRPKKTKTDKTEKTDKTQGLENLPVGIRTIIRNGVPEGDRSEAFFAVVAEFKRRGWNVDDIEALLSKHQSGIAAKYDGRLRTEVERCFDKIADAGAGEWPDISTTGEPKKTYRNALAAIEQLGITCRHDVFHDRMLVGGHDIEQWTGEVTDAAVAAVRQLIIDAYGVDCGKEHVRDAVNWLCNKNRFDPVVEYIYGLEWDGVPRLDQWLTTYLGAPDTPLNRAIGELTLVAAVRRVRQPGCKFDHILVLEGKEGTMKSTAIVTLAGGENFSDQTILTASDREQQELVRGVWIFEIADLAGMKRSEVEKVKAFASRTNDRARPAYGRCRIDAPRRCIFIGTTNDDQYLQSQTGNRRFWPVKTDSIDIDALRRDRDQLWAEAVKIEAKGEPLTLPSELWGDAGAAQDERRQHDPWEDILTTVKGELYRSADGEQEWVRAREVLGYLSTPDRATSETYRRIRRAMERLGWNHGKHYFGGEKQERGYWRAHKQG